MTLNCKPGDIAINVGGERLDHLGVIVTVLRPYTDRHWRAEWVIEYRGKEYAAWDRFLRPIRDPGDDARDESWAYLPPVPTTTKKPEHA